jgi:hypothetical protein
MAQPGFDPNRLLAAINSLVVSASLPSATNVISDHLMT